ncbi:Neoverrucotoxin subunit alpha [Larimichthys crocea]|uniref:Neoverrucotoxin subunit alpha n=1 Tax=Larimichthys crocea TaxID=215358 RepID=A0A6G0HX43_LARCR|nr:Neoverrucotoxin subunit alpha [Larimichthys crocea]
MEAVVKKIPSFNIEGEVDIKLNDEEKALTEKFSCKFYGDFILKSNPATFVDAVKTYVELPKLLGENGENSVPLMVWLMPLKNLDPGAAELMSGISVGLVRKAQDALEDLKEIEMRCNDSLDDGVEHFPQIHKDLSSFKKSCNYYTSHLQQIMGKKFPLIREGKEDESSIKQVFEDRHGSPFSHEKLSEWLDHKEREMNIIRSCVGMMEGVKIVHSQSELDREVLAAGVEHAVCFVFTSLKGADPCFDAMNNYLDSLDLRSTTEDPWYYSDEVLTKMREKAEEVHNLAKALKNNPRVCFLIASIANEKYTGATIYHYKDGILVTDDFTNLNLPPVEEITDRTDLMWYACDLTLDPNTANGHLILSEGNKKATYGSWQYYPDHPERFDKQPQVLCSQGLTGRHYWEVEWSISFYAEIYVGAAYKSLKRKGDSSQSSLRDSAISWALLNWASDTKHTLEPWHNGKLKEIPFPSGCSRVGVYLDWPAGTLSFYQVSSNTLSHLHTFHTTFTEPLHPGFSVSWQSKYAYLCPFE